MFLTDLDKDVAQLLKTQIEDLHVYSKYTQM